MQEEINSAKEEKFSSFHKPVAVGTSQLLTVGTTHISKLTDEQLIKEFLSGSYCFHGVRITIYEPFLYIFYMICRVYIKSGYGSDFLYLRADFMRLIHICFWNNYNTLKNSPDESLKQVPLIVLLPPMFPFCVQFLF